MSTPETGTVYDCDVCGRIVIREAHGGPHPSPGDHDPAYHVAKAYNTGWVPEPTDRWAGIADMFG